MKIPNPLSHAYLITGGREESRLQFAQQVAMAYLCGAEQAPCGQCRHCRKVLSRSHPDLVYVTIPDEKREINVEQARTLRSDAYVSPNEGGRKVYIIHPADAMNTAAQNVLLKVLEDGPAYAAFLLVADEPGALLETVRSRCESLYLPPEETEPNPELLKQAQALSDLLLTGDELAVAERLAEMEQEKRKGGELAQLLALTERCTAEQLAQAPRKGVRVMQILKVCRENAIYNPGPGHTLGWIAAELFRE